MYQTESSQFSKGNRLRIFFLLLITQLNPTLNAEPTDGPNDTLAVNCRAGLTEVGRSGNILIASPEEYFLENFMDFSQAGMTKQLGYLFNSIRWLTKEVNITPQDAGAKPHPQSPSMQLYGEFHPEVDRTVTTIYVLQQILANDYTGFTKPQPAAIRLPEEKFQEIRNLYLRVLSNPKDPIPENASPEVVKAKIDLKKLHTLISVMATHDTAKSKRFVDLAKKIQVTVGVDHDHLLFETLQKEPMMIITFDAIPKEYARLAFDTMRAQFNMGQFAQGENIPGSLLEVKHISPEALDFYYAHLLLDVAGAHAVADPTGAKLLHKPLYANFESGYGYLKRLKAGETETQVYDGFLADRAKAMALPMTNKKERGIVRLALQSGAKNPAEAKIMTEVFDSLPKNAQELLTQELNVNGVDDGWGTLVYYGPQLIANTRAGLSTAMEARANLPILEAKLALQKELILEAQFAEVSDPSKIQTEVASLNKQIADTKNVMTATSHFPQLSKDQVQREGAKMAMLSLARIYEQVRREHLKGKGQSGGKKDGVYTVTIKDLADLAKKDPYAVDKMNFRFEAAELGADLRLEEAKSIDLNQLGKLDSLADIPGEEVIVVGYGGGTDSVQAHMLAAMLEKNGKKVAGVVSARRDKPGSVSSTGSMAAERTLSGPTGGEVAPGVTRILPATQGSGRFVENLPAQNYPTTLVVYDPSKLASQGQTAGDISAATQMEKAIRDLVGKRKNVTVIAVDTGGDSLYPKNVEISGGKATPDQDAEMLTALASATKAANVGHFVSAVIAPGIDSPSNATEVLKTMGAKFYQPQPAEAQLTLDTYAKWQLDGSADPSAGKPFGKTPLAWQNALRGELGMTVLPLPAPAVLSPTNPWNPFLRLQPATSGIMFMDGDTHLKVISGD